MGKILSLCQEAAGLAKAYEWDTFIVQSTFDKKLLAREEELLDNEPIEDTMAIKNDVNKIAIKHLEKLTSKKSGGNDSQMIFNLDFKNMRAKANSSNLFIFGHYIKKSREYCQHDWACSACNGKGCKKCNFHAQNYPSIETAFRKVFAPAFGAADCYLHASGREDVDVMSLGTGRPFVIELTHPRKRHANLQALADELKANSPIEALGLMYCKNFWIETVCTSHFDKHYMATISAERALNDADYKLLSLNLPLLLQQRTPIRVLKRRADLIRHRRIYDLQSEPCEDGKLKLAIWAEAGTYIKEFIHGDTGRTVPSVSSMLQTPCKCDQLDVMGVDDFFIKTLRKS